MRYALKKTMVERIQSLAVTLLQDLQGENTSLRSIDNHIKAAVDWLFVSQDATKTHGSAACYNLILGWERPYPETSGYIIPTLYDVAERYVFPEAEYRADKMAQWLLTTQLPNGAFPSGKYSKRKQEPSVFNTGQILRGLVRSYQETNKVEYRESADAAVEWLAKVQNEEGYWNTHDYKSLSHSYSSRISWPILEAVTEFNFNHGIDTAKSNLRWVLDQQTSNGWFEKCSFKRGNDPFLHTIAYTIRGLLESSRYLDGNLSEQCYHAATQTANRLFNEHKRNGVLVGTYDENWNATASYYCLPGNAQMAIAWTRLVELQQDRKYSDVINETLTFLRSQQTYKGPNPIRGGVQGSAPVWGRYMFFRYPNWACKFFIDALLKAKKLGISHND